MELIAILRLLWSRRWLVGLGVLVSVAAGMAVGSGPSQVLGLGTSRVLIETPRSQIVDATATATGAQSLPNHAPLLADLLATGPARAQIAQRAGVPLAQLAVTDARLNSPAVATPLPVGASQQAMSAGAPYILVVDPINGGLPIVQLDAQTPGAASARRLLDAAAQVLRALAARSPAASGPGLVVAPLAPPLVHQVTHGPRKLYKAAGAIVVLALWCLLTLIAPRRMRRRAPGARRRWRPRRVDLRRALPVGACVLVAGLAAAVSVNVISILPPGLARRDLAVATAETHLLIDAAPPSARAQAPYSTILDPAALPQDFNAMSARASLYAALLTTPPVIADVAARAGLAPDAIDAYLSPDPNVPVALSEPSSERRSTELAGLRRPDLLELQPRPLDPIIDIYAQAPTPAGAARLAQAAVSGLQTYLDRQAAATGSGAAGEIHLEQLGPARGGLVTAGTKTVAGLTFLAVLLLAGSGLALARRRGQVGRPRTPAAVRRWLAQRREDDGGNWPHTTRVLPWMLAVFVAMLWLVPFEQITLNVSLPITLPLDRLLVPVLIGTWLTALAAGGPAAPRLRWTPIHAAVGAFMAVALLSVVLNAPDLNHTQELMAGVKRIPLFMSYLSLFIVAASVIRPAEVRPFLKYMLCLALIMAVGMVVEYRFAYNVFYDLSQRLMPGVFLVGSTIGGTSNGAAVDAIGRRLVQGSAGHPLEAVAMLSIALAIALVFLADARRLAARVGYSVAVCLLLAAMVATFRKSALLAPAAVVVIVAAFRPQRLLKLAPLAVVLLAGVHVIAPGAFGSVTEQLNSGRLNVPTVSDRVVRYDAVRPDVWSHLLFGRGLGTYDHVAHRILDSEFLGRLIETGVLGLITYLGMVVATVLLARRVIATRDSQRAAAALMGAAAAVSFGVLSFMYDTLSFPHGPYLFLCMAGIVAVVSTPETAAPADGRRRPGVGVRRRGPAPGHPGARAPGARAGAQGRLAR